MAKDKENRNTLSINKGIPAPPSVNPQAYKNKSVTRRRDYSVDEYVSGILSCDRTILSMAITLAESSLPEHSDKIQLIIEKCLPHSSSSIRIGITGVPGVGKKFFY